MKKEECVGRLAKLRLAMQAKGVQACIIPSSDAHQSEYTASHWKTRTYFSGFTGSAGTLVVTSNKACLWTDSRYFLQAEEELSGTGIVLQKEGLTETPSIDQWIGMELSSVPKAAVGIDGTVFSVKEVEYLQQALQLYGMNLSTDFDPLSRIWTDRPAIPLNPVFLHPEEFSGERASDKIKRVQEKIAKEGCDSILICALDEIAWVFNVRGNDVACNPVAIAYALITPQESVLFVYPEKVNKETQEDLAAENVKVADYDRLPFYLSAQQGLSIRIDKAKTNYFVFDTIRKLAEGKKNISYKECLGPSPVALLKAVKNETEIKGVRQAMEKDGVALVQLLMWIERSLKTGETITELSIEEKLKELRAKQPYYVGESFDAIVGYQSNGAIVHYHVSEETSKTILPEGMLLIDAGGQYFDGTTDITRTLTTGHPSSQMKRDFTLVLKGHIGIATANFPKGTRGAQLDVLARRFLWNEGLLYLHGTGHGVGHFLNVHEGPQNIRLEENPIPICPGMITSNEPGVYREGQYGIRIENLVLAQKEKETDFGVFYGFETLSLCPIDLSLVEKEILIPEEINWLNAYHRTVYERLSPRLSDEEKAWLKDKTAAL